MAQSFQVCNGSPHDIILQIFSYLLVGIQFLRCSRDERKAESAPSLIDLVVHKNGGLTSVDNAVYLWFFWPSCETLSA